MSQRIFVLGLMLFVPAVVAQQVQKKPFEQQSTSILSYKNEGHLEAVEIKNVVYELMGSGIPGRPLEDRLILRKTTQTKQIVDEIGLEATTTIDAWPLGVDVKQKPLYSITVAGIDPIIMSNQVIVVSRGLEEVSWWSVYKLGNGQHLFDTYVPVVQFSISRDIHTLRYAGLEVPPDDVSDTRLKAPNVVGVLTYASPERVIREALITADDPKLAQILRSYADATRNVAFAASTIRVAIIQNYPSPPKTVTLTVPVGRDDLDLVRSQMPAGLHVTTWKR